jgi:transposase-like protein
MVMAKALTVTEFFTQFPDDDTCLAHLFRVRFGDSPECPKCGQVGLFHKLSKMPAYTCNCGHHIHPMQGTPFENSRTPLQKWFYAMYLFTTTRNGVAAKELQRQLGVTYKTAWRIGHKIREYMAKVDGDWPLGGHVEIDETVVGGKKRNHGKGQGRDNKTIVFGMVERGGDVLTGVIPNVKEDTVEPIIRSTVNPGSTISTDAHRSYIDLKHGYDHGSVNHGAGEYARGIRHTNTIEGFWAMLKRSIRGTHIHVSRKHLNSYLGELEFRFNLRQRPELMFSRLMNGFSVNASVVSFDPVQASLPLHREAK